jgi:NADH-quinone oxidoreductase subunit F
MLKEENKIFNNLYGQKPVSLANAKLSGEFKDMKDILSKGPAFIVEEVKKSGLKGRGGAAFSTGMKWSFIKREDPRPKYLVVNGDEGEPGTCKDREIIRSEPFKLLEGIIYASYVIDAKVCYVYIRGEFYQEAEVLQNAINELYKEGLLGKGCLGTYDLDVYIHLGAGAYICGEESALLESLEGKKGFPRLKPPFPANIGLYGCPTLINNVETLAVIGNILRRGGEWYSKLGVTNSAGTKLFCISGHVNNPCVVEEELGVPLKDIIEKHAGGVIGGWDELLAVIPGGASTPILPKHYCDQLTLDFDALKSVGSALGTGAIMVFNKNTNLLYVMENIVAFYYHESCGQCTPCREGSGTALKIIKNIIAQKAAPEEIDDLDLLMSKTLGTSICGLNDATVFAVRGFLRHYKDSLKKYISEGVFNA